MRRRGEPAGADEERPREVGGGQLPDLPAAFATRDAELIAQALEQNTNLLELYLEGNSITSAGFETIQAVIYNPSSLNAMGSCNHTCYVDCVEEDYV